MPRALTIRNRAAGALACFAVLAMLAAPVRAQDSTTMRTAKVTYVTSASAYLDAGREAGLREGALVQVIRGGTVVGVLKVAFLASRQAACDIVSASSPIVVGDSVRFTPAAVQRDSTVALSPTQSSRSSRTTLRGRAGAHYLVAGQSGGLGFTQPSLDLRLAGGPNPDEPIAFVPDPS